MSSEEPKAPKLEACFKSLIKQDEINIQLEDINTILYEELMINKEEITDENLLYVMPGMLVHYIKSWPGWKKSSDFFENRIDYNQWFEKFCSYIKFKIIYLIKNDFNTAIKLFKMQNIPVGKTIEKKDSSTQTNHEAVMKSVANFVIDIKCSPRQLNTFVFSGNNEDDVFLKQHGMKGWVEISTQQLLNWPHVEVKFMNCDISITRRNVHEFQRYLMEGSDKFFPEEVPFIERVNAIVTNLPRPCYSITVFQHYFDILFNLLEMHSTIKSTDIEIAKAVIKEFIHDIDEINLKKAFGENSALIYNIGGSMYHRSKKLKAAGEECKPVSFSEIIIPRVEVLLHHFQGITQKNGINTFFESMKKLLEAITPERLAEFVPKVEFRCTFCNIGSLSKDNMIKHLNEEHSNEQDVLCYKCKNQVSVVNLTACRWKHVCRS